MDRNIKPLWIATFFLFNLCFIIVSCAKNENKEITFEQETLDSAKFYFQDIAKNPESVSLSNPSIVFSCDSLCIVDFDVRAQNGYGGYNNERMEYVHFSYISMTTGERVRCSVHYDLKKNKSLMEMAKDLIKEVPGQTEVEACYSLAVSRYAINKAFNSPAGQRLFGNNDPKEAF